MDRFTDMLIGRQTDRKNRGYGTMIVLIMAPFISISRIYADSHTYPNVVGKSGGTNSIVALTFLKKGSLLLSDCLA